jgi:hypothetical protein
MPKLLITCLLAALWAVPAIAQPSCACTKRDAETFIRASFLKEHKEVSKNETWTLATFGDLDGDALADAIVVLHTTDKYGREGYSGCILMQRDGELFLKTCGMDLGHDPVSVDFIEDQRVHFTVREPKGPHAYTLPFQDGEPQEIIDNAFSMSGDTVVTQKPIPKKKPGAHKPTPSKKHK